MTVDLSEDCELDTVAFLYAAPPDPLPESVGCSDDEAAVECDDDGGEDLCSFFTYTAPVAGTYYLRVGEWQNDQSGTYVLAVDVE